MSIYTGVNRIQRLKNFRMRRNIAANYAGRIWGIISVYLFIPLYIKFLGIEAYGLVGFYSTLLGVFTLADMGLTATLNREMARLSVGKDVSGDMRDLLRTYETIYIFISLVLSFLIWFLAPLIAERWLRSNILHPHEIATAIRLMGIAVALQLPSGLYMGGLMGLQKQVLSNSLQIAWGVLRGVGAILVLWFFSPTIIAFAFWQLFSNAIFCFSVRVSLWRSLPSSMFNPLFKWLLLRNTWRYAAGMVGMTFVSILLMQTDKLVVSKMLSLEIFGYYTLACALASVPLILANPIAYAMFPRLTGLVAMGDRYALTCLYHRMSNLVAVVVIPGGLTLALFSGEFIFAWTGSSTIAQQTGLVATLLLGGQLMQAIAIVPYYTALAHGQIGLYLRIGIVSVVLITPLLIVLIWKFGIIGAGLSWLSMNFCMLPVGVYFFHRRFMPGEAQQWWLRDVGSPLLIAVPWVLLGRLLMPHTSSRLLIICMIGVVWGLSVTSTAFAIPELRNQFIKKTRKLFGVSYET